MVKRQGVTLTLGFAGHIITHIIVRSSGYVFKYFTLFFTIRGLF